MQNQMQTLIANLQDWLTDHQANIYNQIQIS